MTDGERITALEVKVEHLDRTLLASAKKIDAMHDALQQMTGAKWAVWTLIGTGGLVVGFIVDKLHKLLPFLGAGPR